MKKIRFSISIIVIVFIWFLWSHFVDNNLVAPSPYQSLQALFKILGSSSTYNVLLQTIIRLSISLFISLVMGVVLGFLSGIFERVEHYLAPIVTILRTIPVIAVILIILMTIGKEMSPIVITFLMIFPISYQAILEGIKEQKKEEYMEVYRLDSRLNFKVIFHVYIPLLFPYFKIAMIQSLGLGVKVLVMAEFTSGTRYSIGNEMLKAYNTIDFDKIFAWTIILIALVLFIEVLVNITKKRILDVKKNSYVPEGIDIKEINVSNIDEVDSL